MKIVHISSLGSDHGAGRAAYRIHSEMLRRGRDSVFLDFDGIRGMKKTRVSRAVVSLYRTVGPVIDQSPFLMLNDLPQRYFSLAWFSWSRVRSWSVLSSADVIVLYWINNGFISLRMLENILSLGKPVIWRLSDMWPFTGGCHYSGDCAGYTQNCEGCPYVRKRLSKWMIRRQRSRKARLLQAPNLTIVSPSLWMHNRLLASGLVDPERATIIRTGVDRRIFRKYDALLARKVFSLDPQKKVFLFGASGGLDDPRKGGQDIAPIFEAMAALTKLEDIILVIFGGGCKDERLERMVETKYLGVLRDDFSLALLYSAADVFLAPYREDNLPNTVLEALTCELPVVGYKCGGLVEVVTEGRGRLVNVEDFRSFAEAMLETIPHSSSTDGLGLDTSVQSFFVLMDKIHDSGAKS